MIEKQSAVEELEAILEVPGVDMIQFGPADYAMSLGFPGQFDHPQVGEAERYVIETSLRHGIAPRAEIGGPADAARYLEWASATSASAPTLASSTTGSRKTAPGCAMCCKSI